MWLIIPGLLIFAGLIYAAGYVVIGTINIIRGLLVLAKPEPKVPEEEVKRMAEIKFDRVKGYACINSAQSLRYDPDIIVPVSMDPKTFIVTMEDGKKLHVDYVMNIEGLPKYMITHQIWLRERGKK